MYECTDGQGNTFVFQNFEEIEEFFAEVGNAVGCDDAEITIRYVTLQD